MKIKIIQGDIAKVRADAIVNSAHSSLNAGSGVSGAINRGAGPELLKECREIIKIRGKELKVGEAILTKSYDLTKNGVKIIIHTLAPRSGIDLMGELWLCYENSFQLAIANGCKSIAFPAIATGAHGLDIEKSAWYVRRFLSLNSKEIGEVILVLSNEKDKNIYEKIVVPFEEHKGIMDFANFCNVCLGPISSCFNSNFDSFYCSSRCAERGNISSKSNQKKLSDIISAGLENQKLNDKKKV